MLAAIHVVLGSRPSLRLCTFMAVVSLVPAAFAADNANAPAIPDATLQPAAAAAAIAVPTHRQVATIKATKPGQSQATVACYCLKSDDNLMVGCSGGAGEIGIFEPDGKLVDSWAIPVKPEAICTRPDGVVFVAGEGKILKLAADGKVELMKEAPQAAALTEHPEKLREEVITQAKEQAEQFASQAQIYDKAIEQMTKQIDALKAQLAGLEEKEKATDKVAADSSAEKNKDAEKPRSQPRAVRTKPMLERQIKMLTQQKEQYEQAKTQFAQMLGAQPSGELSDQEIEQRVKASMEYKLKASSISANEDDIFLATRAAAGYGYDVWRMNDQFENATTIIKDLSGCCGQMDVKANKDGVFVAENSHHRVCRFDRDGKSLGNFGFGARTGLEGFGSCCNPMNVAFGPGGAIYTAEDDTGRIKRYSIDGKLLGLVGAIELKPGCKNCSIAVNSDGSRVYMLDIVRNFIVRLDARPADEIAADIEKLKNAPPAPPAAEAGDDDSVSTSTSGAGIVVDALQLIFSR